MCLACLFEDEGLSVELVSGAGSLLDLGWDGEAQGGQLPHLPQQSQQPLRVLDLQLAVHVVQLHHPAAGLQAGKAGGQRGMGSEGEPGQAY